MNAEQVDSRLVFDMRRGVLVALMALLFVLAGCGGPPSGDPEVEWGVDYPLALKADIDRMAARADCSGLQEMSDSWSEIQDATMSETEHMHAGLIAYIDGKLAAAGCS